MNEEYKKQITKFLSSFTENYDNHPLVKYMMSFMPGGQIIDCFISEIANKIKKERFNDLIHKIRKISSDVDGLKTEKVNSEELYDIIYVIVNKSIETRLTELRQIYAAAFVDLINGEEKIYNLESLIGKISDVKEKDLTFLNYIKSFLCINSQKESIFPDNKSLNGENIYKFINNEDFDLSECIWYLNRFLSLGLLQAETRHLTKVEFLPYSPTKYYNKIIDYLEK